MKKALILVIGVMVLASCFLVAGASLEDYKPNWLTTGWEGNQTNILENFWYSLWPFATPTNQVNETDSADMYSWYNGSFFGLANWEREVCLIDLSTDVRNLRNVVEDTALDETNVYTTTITISATKDTVFNNTKLYEVSWYIVPYNNDAYYRVYLKKGDTKEYFVGKKGDQDDDWVLITRNEGASGYDVKYLDNDFEKAVLEYRDYGSDTVNEMSVSVVKKVQG